jgi:hypothetical protein
MHTRLANLNVPAVQRVDDRTIEVIATGLPLRHGSHAIDTMLVSPLTGAAQPRRRSGQYAGATLHTSRQNKERTYPELAGSNRCRLVVLAMEVGGRWSPEAATFLRLLAQTKARETPAPLRHTLVASLIARWSATLHTPQCKHSQHPCSTSQPTALSVAMVSSHPPGDLSPKHHPPPLPPVEFQGGERGLMGRGFRPFGLCTCGDWPV